MKVYLSNIKIDFQMIYKEGEQVRGDDCHTCFCSRGKVICKGEPCTTITPTPTIPREEPRKCVDGWTRWLNKDVLLKERKVFDVEPLPSSIELVNYSQIRFRLLYKVDNSRFYIKIYFSG